MDFFASEVCARMKCRRYAAPRRSVTFDITHHPVYEFYENRNVADVVAPAPLPDEFPRIALLTGAPRPGQVARHVSPRDELPRESC